MSFYGITADYNGPLKQVNAHTDDDRCDLVELARDTAGQAHIGPLRSATRLQHRMYACAHVSAVQMSFYGITANFIGPLKHVTADDNRTSSSSL